MGVVEGFYRTNPKGGKPDVGTASLIQAILGDVEESLKVGFVPSMTNNLSCPALKSIGNLLSQNWEELSVYESSDSEVEMITTLIKEGRGLDVTPPFFAELKVSFIIVILTFYTNNNSHLELHNV